MSRELIDSGIKWLGNIPKTWNVVKVKNIFDSHKNIAGINSENYDRISLTLNGVIKRDKDDANGLQPDNFDTYQIVNRDDIIFKLIDLENVNTSRVGRSKYVGITSPVYILLHEKNNKSKYYDYYFNNLYYQEVFNNLGGNGVRSAINRDDLLNIPLLCIPIEEQEKIANYLDKKCNKIDEIIEDNKKEISLINEYKANFLEESIKGYKTVKMKLLSETIGDGLHGTPEYDENGDYYFINGNNIGNEFLDLKESTDKINETEYNKYKEKNLGKNTIFITLNGATYGKTSFYNGEKVFLGKSAGFITLKDKVNKYYVRFYLMSNIAKREIDLSLAGSTIANVSLETLKNLHVPYPPEDEQETIIKNIKSKIELIEQSVKIREEIIKKLEEYKKALIYEYVTGKKEVN